MNLSPVEFWLRRVTGIGALFVAAVSGLAEYHVIALRVAHPLLLAWSVAAILWSAFYVRARRDAWASALGTATFAGLPVVAIAIESLLPTWDRAQQAVFRAATAFGVAVFILLVGHIERSRFARHGSLARPAYRRWERGVLVWILGMCAFTPMQMLMAGVWREIPAVAAALVAATLVFIGAAAGVLFKRRIGTVLAVIAAFLTYLCAGAAFIAIARDRGWLSFPSLALPTLVVLSSFASGILWLLPRGESTASQ
ncbi:MAG: hypothetical protein HYY84_00435 [Deltaproteobacteria bacterium]|nr:hypothetical protein [Deltaproteobacteria bacterium]